MVTYLYVRESTFIYVFVGYKMFVSVENYINSINLTGMGADRCRIIQYYGLSDGTYTAISSYR